MSSPQKFPIVGIGASAGGIPAMEGFFKGLARDCGMAFVVVTHLSPERESLLHEVIGRYIDMPVKVAEDGAVVEAGTVYVMPHNAVLTMENGKLKLRRPNSVSRERKPVDIFFSALAKDQGEYAVGVVLSGGDSDGTLGVKAIKEYGGLTIAQVHDGDGPRNPDMPQSAISSGLIDLAIPADEMGRKLIDFARGFEMLGSLEERLEQGDDEQTRAAQLEIYRLLHSQSGHDFSGYKTKTFLRRVRRRMQLAQIQSLEAYVERLKNDADETMALFRDLLINVTNFFRDGEAFKTLEETVIPRILEGKGAGDSIRVWVPGCATGEEVYSIAILLREQMEKLPASPRVQIFATDIDEPALAVARAARYPAALLDGVSPERRKRFFSTDGLSCVVTKDVRELCIFSPHSVIRDPPFSRMDLVSCRNLLIYLGHEIQSRIIPTFHYAMKPGGYLFLGTSESISQHGDLFSTVDKKHRIFQAREHAGVSPRLPMLIAHGLSGGAQDAPGKPSRTASYPLRQAVEAQVLERFSPAHVVVNGEGDVVYYSARTGKYLEAAQGAPTRQILTMAKRGLRLDLRSALREALETRRTVMRSNIAVEEDDDRVQHLSLTVEPLADRGNGEPLFLVLFEPQGAERRRGDESPTDAKPDGTADLEQELRDTRERLQSTIEEYETALEELKSSNEELVSVNEEAQSSNEELEASKEELQSLNEELNTINAEMSGKVEELDQANNDLKNLFESTRIATVFLDRKLVIRNFTPAASTFFNLLPADIGRPLTDLSTRLDYPELKQHIADVFKSGEMMERQLARDADDKHYLVRIIPYRDGDSRIEGVVVTFVEVTRLAEAEEHQRVLISELNHRVKNMLAVVLSIAGQMAGRSPTLEHFMEAFSGRLHAMARAYGLLSRENWKEASILQLARQELDPFGIERFDLHGPDIRLKPQHGLSLGMVFHELATNGAKYGALSAADGRVKIGWSLEDGRLSADWRECDGPPVKEPIEKGFGLTLLDGEIGYRLGGEVETSFHEDGLEVRFSFPVN